MSAASSVGFFKFIMTLDCDGLTVAPCKDYTGFKGWFGQLSLDRVPWHALHALASATDIIWPPLGPIIDSCIVLLMVLLQNALSLDAHCLFIECRHSDIASPVVHRWL